MSGCKCGAARSRAGLAGGNRLVLAAGVVMAAGAALAGGAQPAAAQASLAYEAADGCPSQAQFVAAVAERGASLAPADANSAAGPVLRVAIARQQDGFVGTLRLRDARAVPSDAREVHGRSCDEVVDALAVVTAIALHAGDTKAEANAEADSPAGQARAADAKPRAPAADAAAERSATAPEPEPEPPLRGEGDVMPAFAGRRELTVPAGRLRFDRTLALSLTGGAQLGVLPGQLVPRFELSSVRALFVSPPSRPSMLVAPVLRGRISVLGPAAYDTRDTSTRVLGLSAGIGTCFSPRYDTGGLVLLACGELGFGVITLGTEDLAGKRVQSKTLGYGSVGFALALQYNLGSLLHLTLDLGAESTTQPFSAEARDGTRIFRSASFGASQSFAGYGISAHGLLGIGLQL